MSSYDIAKRNKQLYSNAYAQWKKLIKKVNTTIGLKLDPEWHDFKNFYEWYTENYYEAGGEGMSINYTLIDKHPKIVGADTCLIIPKRINHLFDYRNVKNRELPHGVVKMKSKKAMYTVSIRNPMTNTVEYFGSTNTPEQAFKIFKVEKSLIIYNFVKTYRDLIPSNVYNILISYQVERDD